MQLRPIPTSTGRAFFEHALAPGGAQRVELRGGILTAICGNASIAKVHAQIVALSCCSIKIIRNIFSQQSAMGQGRAVFGVR